MYDKEAGETVIRLAKLRSFSDKVGDIKDKDKKEKVRAELEKIL